MDDSGQRYLLAWAELGHRISPLLRQLLREQKHFLVLAGRECRYVQVLRTGDHGCYAEADSGEWTDCPLEPAQHATLRQLGWRSPEEREPRPEFWNYWLELDAPVDQYRLVLLLVRTMADAFGLQPNDVEVEFSLCADAE